MKPVFGYQQKCQQARPVEDAQRYVDSLPVPLPDPKWFVEFLGSGHSLLGFGVDMILI
ncbi:hypothetical protein [Paraburkholderia piptadeniae]|nr:hypothetical protein [Paraburkholderia piptadeniae]